MREGGGGGATGADPSHLLTYAIPSSQNVQPITQPTKLPYINDALTTLSISTQVTLLLSFLSIEAEPDPLLSSLSPSEKHMPSVRTSFCSLFARSLACGAVRCGARCFSLSLSGKNKKQKKNKTPQKRRVAKTILPFQP